MNNQEYKSVILARSHKFSLEIIDLISRFPKSNMTYEVLSKQLLRSGTSIGANLVEAQASSSRRDFANFISYALKSANEKKYWLYLLKESGKVKGTMLDRISNEATEIANMLGSSMLKLRVKNLKF